MTMDINTRIELSNETIKNNTVPGQAGKVGLIGAFPSINQDVHAYTNLANLRADYGIVANSGSEKNFDGAVAAKRIFMDGIEDYDGASSITTVNICDETLDTSKISVQVDDGNGSIEDNENGENAIVNTDKATLLTYAKLKNALTKLADEDIDLLFISADINNAIPKTGDVLYDSTKLTKDGSIDAVIDLILYYLNKIYSTKKPCNWIYWMNCVTGATEGQETDGIGSKIINVKEAVRQAEYIAKQDTTNLATAGIYYQPGFLRKSTYGTSQAVSRMEVAAHMTGFTASLPVTQSLTNQTIPGLTGVSEEAYFGEKDAGGLLMNVGIQVIKPNDRLNGTYCVKNSIQPNFFDVNHIRAVTYLLKQYNLIDTIGEETYDINIEALKAQLETVNKDVLATVPVIKEITVGNHKILSPWKIYIPINIKLYGTIDVIKIGVNMEIVDESNATEVTSTIVVS